MKLKTHWLSNFARKVVICTSKLGIKLSEMGKDMKIKHSVSSPTRKVWGNFFLKNLFMGKKCMVGRGGVSKYMGHILMFYIGTNDQIKQEGRKSFPNEFSSNLNTVDLKIFPCHGGRHF